MADQNCWLDSCLGRETWSPENGRCYRYRESVPVVTEAVIFQSAAQETQRTGPERRKQGDKWKQRTDELCCD